MPTRDSSAHKAAKFLAENTYTQTGNPQKAAQFLLDMVEKWEPAAAYPHWCCLLPGYESTL